MILKEFILKATKIHGLLYTYSNFTKMHDLVNIECSEHGEFTRLAKNHIYLKQGCPKCSPRIPGVRLTISSFIKKSIEVHGRKYDYSKVDYKSIKEKIKIICPEHGEFSQTPQNHIYNRNGCLKCSGNDVQNNEWFVNMGNLIHNNKFDYSKTEYINSKKKVCIICPDHGEFFQNSLTHIHLKSRMSNL